MASAKCGNSKNRRKLSMLNNKELSEGRFRDREKPRVLKLLNMRGLSHEKVKFNG